MKKLLLKLKKPLDNQEGAELITYILILAMSVLIGAQLIGFADTSLSSIISDIAAYTSSIFG